MILPLLERFGSKVRFMRDPTRGGVGVTLNEMASSAKARFVLEEERLPVRESVRGVCEILGFDPLYLANEGKALLIVDASAADDALAAPAGAPAGKGSRDHRRGPGGDGRRPDADARGGDALRRLPRGGPAPAHLLKPPAEKKLIFPYHSSELS